MIKKFLLITLLINNLIIGQGCCINPFYARVEFGESFAHCAKICPDLSYWVKAVEGYNGKIKHAPVYTAAIGANINSWFSFGFSTTHRSRYRYCKFQTSTLAPSPTATGNRTRFFDLDITSYMLDLFFNRSGYNSCFALRWCNTAFVPYFGIGFGGAKNSIYNFHAVGQQAFNDDGSIVHRVNSAMFYFTKNRICWHAQIGLDFYVNQCIAFGLGYRYFDVGHIESNNYVVNNHPSAVVFNMNSVPSWCFKFRAHEFVGSVSFEF